MSAAPMLQLRATSPVDGAYRARCDLHLGVKWIAKAHANQDQGQARAKARANAKTKANARAKAKDNTKAS